MPGETPLTFPGQGTFPENIPRQIQCPQGFSVIYKGKTLLSRLDPAAQAERIVTALTPVDRTLYFCPSPLYGYGLEKLLDKLEQTPHSAVLCVEADEQLLALSQKTIPPLFPDKPRLCLTGTRDPAGLCALVRKTWGSRSFRRLETLRLSAGWRLDPELYDSLAEALNQDIALDWGNAMTLLKLGRLYIKNAIKNLNLIPRAPSLSKLSFYDDPILILGAGPSLDATLEGLSAHFGELLSVFPPRPFRIVTVDTALPCLMARNIKPDLVVALESQHWNLRDFIGSGDWKIPVLMDLSALPATREILGGRTCLFYTPWADIRLFRRLEAAGLLPALFPPLGSVALSAAAIALSLGSGPVLTGGIDFSFTLDKYHARSTPGHQEKLRRQNRFRDILNIGAAFRPAVSGAAAKSGTAVRCDPAMRGYRDLFKREFAGEKRLHDIVSDGLPLGPLPLDMAAACALLETSAGPAPARGGGKRDAIKAPAAELPDPGGLRAAALRDFACRERDSLIKLRKILTGETPAVQEELEGLLDGADYLWAHFPDCAGTGGRRPPGTDISFLKRVRAELDLFIGLWEQLLAEPAP
ncbi:MAG: DUF115 domain-containing protein [Treponema sp.]|jgi:hypothetical protein|nr:DUF115 domain-containing protein [Treponema sp.]